MSALKQGDPEAAGEGKMVHKFVQKVPIQSYLIAIAVGRLESRKLGSRCRVWSEKELVDKAAEEFSDTEKMLETAEKLCGPYVWGEYGILVLPPSFPYGGMENPCLTFVTPALLTGDKSLVTTIVHEITHSWTGNLVSNKNFEHFWLNEGFTRFSERKIIGRLAGEAMRHFLGIVGWKDLKYEITEVMGEKNPLTSLVVDLTGVDPDDAFCIVPYEKGNTFLWYLEEKVGGPEKMEPFLRSYYDKFKYKSIDSDQFKDYFLEHFQGTAGLDTIDWKTWFYGPGMPDYDPNYDDSLAQACRKLKDKWVNWDESTASPFKASDLKDLTGWQRVEFIALLLQEEPLSQKKLETMSTAYGLNEVSNVEIGFRWIRLCLRGKWKAAVPKAVELVGKHGRMKYIRPLYRDLYNWNETRDVALETFEKNRGSMMQVAVQAVEKDLKLS